MDRKGILEHAASPEDRIFLARILDKIEAAAKKHDTVVTDFCDPYQQNLISPVLSKAPGLSFMWQGGHPAAERQRLVLCPDYLDITEVDAGLLAISVTGNLKFQQLTHRDYLGAVMGLGIKREKTGDLLVTDHGCQLIVEEEIADYITRNLDKVHRLSVKTEIISLNRLQLPEEKVSEKFATVASLRLDAVVAAAYGVSRGKIVAEISSEKVKVNWTVITDSSHPVKEGDKISVRGRGRAEIEQIKGETKKGRISLAIKRYQ